MSPPGRWRLQLDDRPPNPQPHALPVAIPAIEHLVGALGRHDPGVVSLLLDKQVGGPARCLGQRPSEP